jgi:hypothetical protein
MKKFLSYLPKNLKIKDFPQLNWLYFNGKPEENSQFDACLKWGIYYSYKKNSSSGIFELDVQVKIEEGSWYKKGRETEYLLNHERGHYVIALIYGNHFKNNLLSKKLKMNYENFDYEKEIYYEFNLIFEECLEIQALYDCETNHSILEESQRKWNEILCL